MYTTDENLRDFYSVDENVKTTELKQYIKAVSAFMDKEAGYKIAHDIDATGVDVFFDGSCERHLDFGDTWITSFAKVYENDIEITDDVVAYPLNESYINYLQKKGSNFAEGYGNIKLTEAKIGAFTLDWRGDGHTLPYDLELACKTLVVSILKYKENGGERKAGNITQEKTSQYTISYGGVTGENSSDVVEAMRTIHNYKNFFIA